MTTDRRFGRSRRLAGAAVTALLAGIVTVSDAGPAAATVSGSEGRILYVSPTTSSGTNLEIYSVTRTGQDRVNLSASLSRDQDPAWSPDGTRIAWASSRAGSHLDIWVMNADGSGKVNLTPGADTSGLGLAGVEPEWAPDGASLAYTYQGDVWVMNADGSAKRNLTEDPALVAAGTMPAWSPDGSTIAYVRQGDIWMMDADGSDKRNVTNSAGSNSAEKYPDWSPDGLRLVYERAPAQIWTMNADGSEQKAISAGFDKGGTRPVWSPEGDYVLFSSTGYSAETSTDLFALRPDGSGIARRVTRFTFSESAASWASDQSGIATSTYVNVDASSGPPVTATGEAFGAQPGQTIRLALQQHLDGAWRTVQGRFATLDDHADYAVTFTGSATATNCRVLAWFEGDADSLASPRAFEQFACP